MSTTIVEARPWDLTHLVRFLPGGSDDLAPASEQQEQQGRQHEHEHILQSNGDREPRVLDDSHYTGNIGQPSTSTSTSNGLGNFDKVWQFLGTPTADLNAIPSKDDYASDGATYQFSSRRVTHDSEEGTDGHEDAATFGQSVLTNAAMQDSRQRKKDRKKASKRERKALLAAGKRTVLSESECDSTAKDTPARKASSHVIPKSMTAKAQSHEQSVAEAAVHSPDDELPDTPCPKPKLLSKPSNTNNAQVGPSTLTKPLETLETKKVDKVQLTTPNIYKTSNLIPSSVQPLRNGNINNSPRMAAPTSVKIPVPAIQPLILRSGEDRDYALFLKIMRDFGSDRKHMVKPMNLTTHSNDPSGIHVFIDASNIFIGFNKMLKSSRNMHSLQSGPDANLSFDSLALLIERRRPVAKRVLVGSTPHVPAFDKAKEVGYECSILAKVLKARELTERQIYFKERDQAYFGRKSSTKAPPPPHKVALSGSVLSGSINGASGSETSTPPRYAPQAWIEQGVDEILHLKICESVLDNEVPSTIVLATGDAACAEYSSGFQAMVERALRRGWKVELTSWSKNISSTYRLPAWTAAWGSQFKIIELDDYAEELLDM